MKKKLYVVTNDYPNQGGDSIFIMPELQELAKRFCVTVICTSGQKKCENLLDGVTYLFYTPELTLVKKIKYALLYFGNKFCWKEMQEIFKKSKGDKIELKIRRILKSIEFFACGEDFFRYFKKNVDSGSQDEAIYYTFWCNSYSLPLILHRKRYSNYHLITRLHGYDLYEERYLYNRQPFKEVINYGLDKLFFIAERPMQYYLEKHLELNPSKAEVIRLGVEQIVLQKRREHSESAVVISCSNVIPLKRVDIIINALSILEEDIFWIHFGTGECMTAIRDLAQKKLDSKHNITYKLMGYVTNKEIRRFYEENEVECFLTTSSTEGCPVSVMEALAAGIPVIGTAVGEIPFMINRNGILLGENPSEQEVARAIQKVIRASYDVKNSMREESLRIWTEYYDSKKNAPCLAQKLLELLM